MKKVVPVKLIKVSQTFLNPAQLSLEENALDYVVYFEKTKSFRIMELVFDLSKLFYLNSIFP